MLLSEGLLKGLEVRTEGLLPSQPRHSVASKYEGGNWGKADNGWWMTPLPNGSDCARLSVAIDLLSLCSTDSKIPARSFQNLANLIRLQ